MANWKDRIGAAALAAALATLPVAAEEKQQWIVTDAAAAARAVLMSLDTAQSFRVVANVGELSVAVVDEGAEPMLRSAIDSTEHRCGGYTVHDSYAEALAEARNPFYSGAARLIAPLPPIDQQAVVVPTIGLVDPAQIVSVIRSLEGLGSRYYRSNSGQVAASQVKALWESYGGGRADVTVTLKPHDWPQNSVIATIAGAELPDEIVVIGAHLDSINPSDLGRAPGADDDASGIAVVSEVLRVLASSGFKPKRTLMFVAYAAEEVGLRGSRDVARSFATSGQRVVAALQMDMTGFGGSPEDLYFVTDYVSADLTTYLKDLIVTYNGAGPHRISFGETACGYACSDHASWTGIGVPSAFPFEARFEDYNHKIHSSEDTLPNIDTSGARQARFAKLGIEYMIELGKSAGK